MGLETFGAAFPGLLLVVADKRRRCPGRCVALLPFLPAPAAQLLRQALGWNRAVEVGYRCVVPVGAPQAAAGVGLGDDTLQRTLHVGPVRLLDALRKRSLHVRTQLWRPPTGARV